jgi:two-component sensor histidine kinase
VTELRSSRQKIEDSFAQLQNEHTRLKLAHSSIIDTTDTERLTFTSRIRELEKQVADTKHWRGRADSLSIQLEETKRMNEEKGRDREDKKDDRRTEDVVRLELKRESWCSP